ncbi:hypothetical protein SAMN05428944_5072 [Streptomyces sp. 1222.5]|uniref:hypothetical protein n=1 Tax=unclassified Streptomyces TaxID=2593676 RepID=UPI000898D2B1|nr:MULTISPECIES: hypothetical protein [unclassified Streptomyces]PKW07846.1 hypothetical protein BX260_3025 [Streptomyces sp. 5112.2]SEC78371.1 hypothetical protein SAMN05428944_5072 [Streptomyces sp. 1222.5]SED01829.1 hypothetical protein SAMN05216532_3140 [Streptomyces sp. 2231.1]
MTAGHDSARGAEDAGEYGGMDALMAAITGDPLPADARRDPAFLAEHRAAEADLALLREHLDRLARALTEEPLAEGREDRSPESPAPSEGPAPSPAPAGRPAGGRPRSVTRPAGPSRPPRPGRPSGPRRALRIALGTLAGAAACSLVVGFGWLVTQAGLGADDSAGDAKSAADAGGKSVTPEAAGRPADPERELACSRLVVEGTVVKVQRRQGSSWSRVTLTVTRSYRPAHGPAEVGFLLDGTAEPAPRTGQHVLVRVARGEERASLWSVGDTRVAADRAWIVRALPGSRHTACTPEGGS